MQESTFEVRRYRVVVTTAMTVVCGDDIKDETEADDRKTITQRWGDRLVSIERLDK